MKFQQDDRIEVTLLNYEHRNRCSPPRSIIVGLKGIIIKPSATENAYFIQLETGDQVYLYEDEIRLI